MLLNNGLMVNPSKSDFLNISGDNFQSVKIAIQSTLLRVTVTKREDLGILGAQIDINRCRIGVP